MTLIACMMTWFACSDDVALCHAQKEQRKVDKARHEEERKRRIAEREKKEEEEFQKRQKVSRPVHRKRLLAVVVLAEIDESCKFLAVGGGGNAALVYNILHIQCCAIVTISWTRCVFL